MNDSARYLLPLSSTEATLVRAGGKGANLAKLVQAGFRVPAAFIVSTDAYRAFVEANQLQARILGLLNLSSSTEGAALESTAAAIAALFEQGTVPADIATAITSAYGALSVPAVAVRSSATAEDLPGLAFAGQQESYLNVIGAPDVLHAVKQCWGSLWTARAIVYRQRAHIPPGEVALAVVIQHMLPSESSGVVFTANPLTGRRAEIVIDATFGLGEALVSGQVDPDHYSVDPHTWTITERKLGAKQIAIHPKAGGGTQAVEGLAAQQPALTDEQLVELARTAQRAAECFTEPQDIEWAWAEHKLYLLQARPITSLYPLPEPLASEHGLRTYLNFNGIQGVNEPFTP